MPTDAGDSARVCGVVAQTLPGHRSELNVLELALLDRQYTPVMVTRARGLFSVARFPPVLVKATAADFAACVDRVRAWVAW